MLGPPRCVGQGSDGPACGLPAPDSSKSTGLHQAAEPSHPGSSAGNKTTLLDSGTSHTQTRYYNDIQSNKLMSAHRRVDY